jgi:hypothetical protein
MVYLEGTLHFVNNASWTGEVILLLQKASYTHVETWLDFHIIVGGHVTIHLSSALLRTTNDDQLF